MTGCWTTAGDADDAAVKDADATDDVNVPVANNGSWWDGAAIDDAAVNDADAADDVDVPVANNGSWWDGAAIEDAAVNDADAAAADDVDVPVADVLAVAGGVDHDASDKCAPTSTLRSVAASISSMHATSSRTDAVAPPA